jgi:hypothetical protein
MDEVNEVAYHSGADALESWRFGKVGQMRHAAPARQSMTEAPRSCLAPGTGIDPGEINKDAATGSPRPRP